MSDANRPILPKHTPQTAYDSPLSQVVDAIHNAGQRFVFSVAHAFGRTTTERRVSKRFHKVRWALEHRQENINPAQRQALAMLYGCVMPPAECADRLGISRQAFRERLMRGEGWVDRLWSGDYRRLNPKKGRPNAMTHAPEGAAWMYLKASERLGAIPAQFIWGSDDPPDRLTDAEFEQEYGVSIAEMKEALTHPQEVDADRIEAWVRETRRIVEELRREGK